MRIPLPNAVSLGLCLRIQYYCRVFVALNAELNATRNAKTSSMQTAYKVSFNQEVFFFREQDQISLFSSSKNIRVLITNHDGCGIWL